MQGWVILRGAMPAYQRFYPQRAWILAHHLSRSPPYPASDWLCRSYGWSSPCTTTIHVDQAQHIQQDPRLLDVVAYSADTCESCLRLHVSSVLEDETGLPLETRAIHLNVQRPSSYLDTHLDRPTSVLHTTSNTLIRLGRFHIQLLAG